MSRLTWADPGSRFFETGLDRGVLYPTNPILRSYTLMFPGTGNKTFELSPGYAPRIPLGTFMRITTDTVVMTGLVVASSVTSITVNVTSAEGYTDIPDPTSRDNWTLVPVFPGVPWNGLLSFDENASSGVETYHQDGRPYLNLPLPKEFSGTLKAYTYPDLFSQMIGYAEATQGMYVDSQMGNSFGLSYRTKVGNDLDGIDHGYKIHLVYQATVGAPSQSFETLSNSISPQEFSFEISTVPLPLEGFAPMAHVILDSRTFDPDELAQVEDILYGTSGTPPQLPKPQELYDLLTVGDHIEIVDNGDGTWSAIGSAENVYITTPGEFEIDNVNAVIPGADGPGSYDVSSTP